MERMRTRIYARARSENVRMAGPSGDKTDNLNVLDSNAERSVPLDNRAEKELVRTVNSTLTQMGNSAAEELSKTIHIITAAQAAMIRDEENDQLRHKLAEAERKIQYLIGRKEFYKDQVITAKSNANDVVAAANNVVAGANPTVAMPDPSPPIMIPQEPAPVNIEEDERPNEPDDNDEPPLRRRRLRRGRRGGI